MYPQTLYMYFTNLFPPSNFLSPLPSFPPLHVSPDFRPHQPQGTSLPLTLSLPSFPSTPCITDFRPHQPQGTSSLPLTLCLPSLPSTPCITDFRPHQPLDVLRLLPPHGCPDPLGSLRDITTSMTQQVGIFVPIGNRNCVSHVESSLFPRPFYKTENRPADRCCKTGNTTGSEKGGLNNMYNYCPSFQFQTPIPLQVSDSWCTTGTKLNLDLMSTYPRGLELPLFHAFMASPFSDKNNICDLPPIAH